MINEKDIIIERFSGHGPGGQKRNKAQNCVRATHVPTGITVTETKQRSFEQNRKNAFKEIERRLQNLKKKKVARARHKRYNSKDDAAFGSKDVVRTYRMTGNLQGITDHKTGKTASLDVLLKGKLELLQ